jgi:hypothetical protein
VLGALLTALAMSYSACHDGSISGPSETLREAKAPEAAPVSPASTPVGDPVTQPADPQVECYVGDGGSFYVRTTGGSARQYAAWTTSFDNQSLPLEVKGPVIRQPGDAWDDSFKTRCRQVDVGGVLNGTPICFGYIDQNGTRVAHHNQITDEVKAACRVPPPCEGEQCEPSPEPTPEPSPEPPPLTCAQLITANLDTPGPRCVELNGGQDNECAQVAQAFANPVGSLNGLTFDGSEAQITNAWVWSQAANFAFVVDANECAQSPKAVRVVKNTAVGGAVPFDDADVDGGSATYCYCLVAPQ